MRLPSLVTLLYLHMGNEGRFFDYLIRSWITLYLYVGDEDGFFDYLIRSWLEALAVTRTVLLWRTVSYPLVFVLNRLLSFRMTLRAAPFLSAQIPFAGIIAMTRRIFLLFVGMFYYRRLNVCGISTLSLLFFRSA